MSACPLEVADVFREHGKDFLARSSRTLSGEELEAFRAIARCRTAALGGHLSRCESCGHEEISYNSCRNRHCPKCQARARAQWLEQEASHLLPVEYFHVLFTLPAAIRPLVFQNKRKIYDALFRAASRTLQTIAADPRHLGGEIGFLAVLHSWGQTLELHPHLHCVVPGGALSADGSSWIPCRKGFFLSVGVLSRMFRGKFRAELERLQRHGELELPSDIADRRAWKRFLRSLGRKDWVVYSKPPFGGPQQVLKYLARYTHRVAISNRRLLSLEDGKVRFRYKDYARGEIKRVMTLDAPEFIRRFLLHVLPRGFVRIRHYGFLSNRSRRAKLELLRRLLDAPSQPSPAESNVNSSPALETSSETQAHEAAEKTSPCPLCKTGRLVLVEHFPKAAGPSTPRPIDSS